MTLEVGDTLLEWWLLWVPSVSPMAGFGNLTCSQSLSYQALSLWLVEFPGNLERLWFIQKRTLLDFAAPWESLHRLAIERNGKQ